jgi:hypothetical protein
MLAGASDALSGLTDVASIRIDPTAGLMASCEIKA